jgi:hypothetical protein
MRKCARRSGHTSRPVPSWSINIGTVVMKVNFFSCVVTQSVDWSVWTVSLKELHFRQSDTPDCRVGWVQPQFSKTSPIVIRMVWLVKQTLIDAHSRNLRLAFHHLSSWPNKISRSRNVPSRKTASLVARGHARAIFSEWRRG